MSRFLWFSVYIAYKRITMVVMIMKPIARCIFMKPDDKQSIRCVRK